MTRTRLKVQLQLVCCSGTAQIIPISGENDIRYKLKYTHSEPVKGIKILKDAHFCPKVNQEPSKTEMRLPHINYILHPNNDRAWEYITCGDIQLDGQTKASPDMTQLIAAVEIVWLGWNSPQSLSSSLVLAPHRVHLGPIRPTTQMRNSQWAM